MTPDSSIARFWGWFLANEPRLFHFEHDIEGRFDELAGELARVDADLTFEFGPVRGGVRDFVVSAGGLRHSFPAVEALVDACPGLRRFRVIKFRPRRAPTDLEFNGLAVKAQDVYFRFARDEDPAKLGVLLFLPGYSSGRERDFGQIAFLFLDEALGEFDVETRVGFVDVFGHDSAHFAGASPISQMASRFDALFAARG